MGAEGEVMQDAHGEPIKRYSYMEAYRKRVVKVSVWVVLTVLATGCEHYKPTPETVGDLLNDPFKALNAVQSNFNKRVPGRPCYTDIYYKEGDVTSYSISGSQLKIACSNGAQLTFRYRDTPMPEADQEWAWYRVNLRSIDGWGKIYWGEDRFELAKEFAQAWYVLAQRHNLQDPATDSVFIDAVKHYQADPQTRAETFRRVQVQVESALKEHRVREAGILYRDALKSAAGWPEGHFNLALLFGDLEFYTDAINEMRRYLFLVPTAPDARAAQDKIYEWERKTQ